MTQYVETKGVVYHMEAELDRDYRILVAEQNSLQAFVAPTRKMNLVGTRDISGYQEGQGRHARFNTISGFAQINATHIVIVDRFNYCLRWLDRSTGQTSVFAGTCQHPGSSDGSGTRAQFTLPYAVIHDQLNNRLVVTDSATKGIRIISMRDLTVITPSGSGSPSDQLNRLLIAGLGKSFLSNGQYVANVNLERADRKSTQLVIDGLGFDVADVVQLTKEVFVFADTTNLALKVVNIKSGQVYSVCGQSAIPENADGDVDTCSLRFPFSLLLIKDNLYVGTNGEIRIINRKQALVRHHLNIGSRHTCMI